MSELIHTEEQLLEVLSTPSRELIEFVPQLKGPLVVLGAGGKMGPTLCVQVKRAAEAAEVALDVVAVSRFSDPKARNWLEEHGVKTVSSDLFSRTSVKKLPAASHVIYLVGLKFGTQQDPARTWATNALVPSYVAERYPKARMVALSTGNVYPFVPVDRGGSVESDALTPIGEYANACVARERIFQYYAQESALRIVMIRLNYALELRYGILIDLAQKIKRGQTIDLTMGYFNCIWQGEANDAIVRSLQLAEESFMPLNLTGKAICSVKDVALQLGARMGTKVRFIGTESSSALLSDSQKAHRLLGEPEIDLETMIAWTASWITQGGQTLDKPTHFEVRSGAY